jgi:hypothetical protein
LQGDHPQQGFVTDRMKVYSQGTAGDLGLQTTFNERNDDIGSLQNTGTHVAYDHA